MEYCIRNKYQFIENSDCILTNKNWGYKFELEDFFFEYTKYRINLNFIAIDVKDSYKYEILLCRLSRTSMTPFLLGNFP